MDQSLCIKLNAGIAELTNSSTRTNENFLSEQEVYETWDEPMMAASMNGSNQKIQGYQKMISSTIEIIDEAGEEAIRFQDNESLSDQGKWDGRMKLYGGVYKVLNSDIEKRINDVDDEIERLSKNIKFHHTSTGNMGADESRMSEIRSHFRDENQTAKDHAFFMACQSGSQWVIRAMLESPMPMLSEDMKEKGMTIRARREDPSRSYSLEQHQHLKKQLQLTKTRVNKSLADAGYSPDENNVKAQQIKVQHFANLSRNKRAEGNRRFEREKALKGML